jgi:23S rRNA pseudouridine2605 synthase
MVQRREQGKRFDKRDKSDKRPVEPTDDPIRLNRFIANSGVCSRREADKLIEQGKVKVNGEVVREMGHKVMRTDEVLYNGKKLVPEKKVYVLLNKPKDTVTTSNDPEGRRTVIDLVKRATSERIYPVGRLDRNTTGVLLFTNDGDMAKKLAHPSSNVRKIYHVFLDKHISKADFDAIAAGVELEDGPVKPDELSYPDPQDKTQLGIEIHSGKNRIVRRIFASKGYDVIKLDRVYFGGLTKKNVPRGKWRLLTDQEVGMLSML